MRFEVFIPAASPRGLDVSMDVKARNWLAALKLGLERCGEDPDALRRTLCDIQSDASVHVSDAASRRVFRIKPLAEGERVASPPEPVSRTLLADSSPHTMLLHHVGNDPVDPPAPALPSEAPVPDLTDVAASADATIPAPLPAPEAPDTLKFDPIQVPEPDEAPADHDWVIPEVFHEASEASVDVPPEEDSPPPDAADESQDPEPHYKDTERTLAPVASARAEVDFVDLDDDPPADAPSATGEASISSAPAPARGVEETTREDRRGGEDEAAGADEIDALFSDERRARTMMMQVVDAEVLKERGASVLSAGERPPTPLKARPQARISTAARMKALPSGALRPDGPISVDTIGHRKVSQEHDPQLEQMLATHRKQSSSTLKVVTAAHLKVVTAAHRKVTSANNLKAVSETALEDIFLEIPDLFETGKTLEEGTDFVMNLATNAIASESASIIYATPDGRELYFATARGPGASSIAGTRMPIEKGIAGFCTRHGVTLMVDNAREEPRFYAELTDELDLTVTSLMCVPIQHNGRVYGCIQLLNHEEGRTFSHAQLDALGYIGFQLGKFIYASL